MRLAALLVCSLAVLPARAATVGDPVASRSAEAQAHYDAGRYDEALRAYRDALVERPESGALHLNVGDALYQLGDYENALQEFERAAAAPEADLAARGFYNKGNTHFQLKDYAAAVEAYKQSLELTPQDIDAKANLELALRLLQTPPPQPQEGGEDTEESEDSGDKQQQDQSSEGESAEAEDESEPQAGDDESEDEQTPEEQQSDAPDEGEDENADSADEDQAQTDESAPMDEKEAEQLLDALNDRDAQSQQRRYRAKRRGDDKQDW
ncbi:MAG: tetratricopeptide repeat protein [bacterium]|nr:tetratricopeptide repeat protein [bacterium]